MKIAIKGFMTTIIISSSLFCVAHKAHADIKLTTGTTVNTGRLAYRATFNDGTQTNFSLELPAGTQSLNKAEIIENQFKNPLLGQKPVDVTRTGNMLIFKGIKRLQKLVDGTGEKSTMEAVNKQKPTEASYDGELIEVAPSLSGLDDDGNESLFLASLGFETNLENVFISSELLFSELGGNSIDDWLSAIFIDLQEQLPVEFQSNLSLDLTNDEISFIFPENIRVGSGIIESQTTDSNASGSLSIETESVPEFSSTLSLLALGTLGATSTLKRKKNHIKSAKKETTTIG